MFVVHLMGTQYIVIFRAMILHEDFASLFILLTLHHEEAGSLQLMLIFLSVTLAMEMDSFEEFLSI